MGYTDDEILRALNDAISSAPSELADSAAFDKPVMFICGAPRSGTTLLYQLLAYVGDVGYVNNLIARFYANPPLGAWLSEQAQIDRVFLPKSVYGRTFGASSPHEFGRFWLDAFGLDAIGEPDDDPPAATIVDAARRIARLGAVFNRPMVFKSFDYLWFIDELAATLPSTKWIHIVRERESNIGSLTTLYETRATDGVAPAWTSATLRATRARHADAPLPVRVAAQIDDLNTHIATCLERRPTADRITVQLTDLTSDPAAVTAAVFDHLGVAYDRTRLQTAANILGGGDDRS